MASGSTPVQARPYPLESDVPDVAADMETLALSLEDVSADLENVIALRPSAASTPGGTRFYASDTKVLYYCADSLWRVVSAATVWTNLTPSTGWQAQVSSGAQVRQEGDAFRFRGALTNISGGTITSGQFGAIPSAFTLRAPSAGINLVAPVMNWGTLALTGMTLFVVTSANALVMTGNLAVPNGQSISLDGLTCHTA